MSFRHGYQQGAIEVFCAIERFLTLLRGKFCRLGLRRTFPCGGQRRCSAPMKQLNWWHVWIIGTVAWAAWTFWKSDPRCLIINGDRWCYYGSDFEYYAWLLVQMFGWPVLIGILLLALRCTISWFEGRLQH